jgi:4-aminobutyrate aminotransferase-like enzyme
VKPTATSISLGHESCIQSPLNSRRRAGTAPAVRWYDPYPLFFTRAIEARLWDADGNRYIDLNGGLGPCVLGYNPPEIVKAATETLVQSDRIWAFHPGEVQLSRQLTELIPCAEKVALCGGGSSDPCYMRYACRVPIRVGLRSSNLKVARTAGPISSR